MWTAITITSYFYACTHFQYRNFSHKHFFSPLISHHFLCARAICEGIPFFIIDMCWFIWYRFMPVVKRSHKFSVFYCYSMVYHIIKYTHRITASTLLLLHFFSNSLLFISLVFRYTFFPHSQWTCQLCLFRSPMNVGNSFIRYFDNEYSQISRISLKTEFYQFKKNKKCHRFLCISFITFGTWCIIILSKCIANHLSALRINWAFLRNSSATQKVNVCHGTENFHTQKYFLIFFVLWNFKQIQCLKTEHKF